jgi:hypothetical protein
MAEGLAITGGRANEGAMGGNQGGQLMTERESNGQTNGGRGTQASSNSDWNPDQAGQVKDVKEQGPSIGNRHRTSTPDGRPLQDDEDGVGSTEPAGSQGTTRY